METENGLTNSPSTSNIEDAVKAVRKAEAAVVGAGIVQRHVEHADAHDKLVAALTAADLPIKQTFAKRKLDYQSAQRSVRVRRAATAHPNCIKLGPKKLLVLDTLATRFGNESEKVAYAEQDLLKGMSVSMARGTYLTVEPGAAAPSVRRVIDLLLAGKDAKPEFDRCDDALRTKLQAVVREIDRLCGIEDMSAPIAATG